MLIDARIGAWRITSGLCPSMRIVSPSRTWIRLNAIGSANAAPVAIKIAAHKAETVVGDGTLLLRDAYNCSLEMPQ